MKMVMWVYFFLLVVLSSIEPAQRRSWQKLLMTRLQPGPSVQVSNAVNITQQVVFGEDYEELPIELPM